MLRTDRRGFFRLGLGAVAAGTVLSGCDAMGGPDGAAALNASSGAATFDFSGDIGVLNFAYALEQLEYAFYEQVTQGAYFQGLDPASEERLILQDLRDHELAHRDFFAAAIPALGGTPIPMLEVDFSSIDFSSRESVLSTAQTFEDTGVSAYNGAGHLLSDPGLLTIAGKIVSVEARHAAAIRSVFSDDPRAFAGDDVVDPVTGLDVLRRPHQVLNLVQPFITTPLRMRNAPA